MKADFRLASWLRRHFISPERTIDNAGQTHGLTPLGCLSRFPHFRGPLVLVFGTLRLKAEILGVQRLFWTLDLAPQRSSKHAKGVSRGDFGGT